MTTSEIGQLLGFATLSLLCLAERLDFAERMPASRPVADPRRIRPTDQPDLLITPH